MIPKYCPNCGCKSATATSKFCASCGHPLDALTKQVKNSTANIEDDPDGSDVSAVPDIQSLAVVAENDNEQEKFGKSFSFSGGDFLPAKFKPRTVHS